MINKLLLPCWTRRGVMSCGHLEDNKEYQECFILLFPSSQQIWNLERWEICTLSKYKFKNNTRIQTFFCAQQITTNGIAINY